MEPETTLKFPGSTSNIAMGSIPAISKISMPRNNLEIVGTDMKNEGGISCVLCAGSTDDTWNIYCEMTWGDVTLCSYIYKVANLNLEHRTISKYACRSCFKLLNLIEKAELEYTKHRDILLDIISHNPALAGLSEYNTLEDESPCMISIEKVKVECYKSESRVSSEDDEPLACLKAACTTKTNTANIPERSSKYNEDRHFSSDDDFTWKVKSEEENCNPKKKKSKQKHKHIKKCNINPDDAKINTSNAKAQEKDLAHSKFNKSKYMNNMENKYCDNDPSAINMETNGDLKCDKCNRVFKKRCYLDKHSHCKKPYICEVCGRGFKSPKLCNAHVLMHKGIADYKCIPCNKLFPTKVAFLRHDKIHNGVPSNQCDLCGKSFIHQSSLRMHKLAHAGVRRHICDVCGLALLSNSLLTRHRLVHTGEKKFACAICGKKFARNSNMHTHMKTHTKDKQRPPTPPDIPGKRKNVFRCEMCPERFDRLFKLEIHLVDDHKVVLKKGRPKPRNTMKKLQRAQQAAASVVNSIATAMAAKRASLMSTITNAPVDVKLPISNLNEKVKEGGSDNPVFKSSPRRQSSSPGATFISPPSMAEYSQESSETVRMDYQDHQLLIRTAAGATMPLPLLGAEYLGRLPDYSKQ